MESKKQIEEYREYEEYREFTENHTRSHLFQSIEWGQVKIGWINEIVTVRNKEGKICATMSILIKKIPLFPYTFMYAPRGPVCDLHNRKQLEALMESAKEIAAQYHAMVLKIDTDTPAEDREYAAIMQDMGFELVNDYYNFEGVQARFLMRVDLKNKTEEELLNGFHSKTRYNIRLAQRKGVQIKIGTREDIPLFYSLLKITSKRDGFTVREIEYFYRLFDALGKYCRIFLAYAGNEGAPQECVSAAIVGLYGNKSLYLYGASGNKFRNYMPNYLLQWEIIRFSMQSGCSVYDLRGVPGNIENPGNPIFGLYKFKKGFAGKATEMIGEFNYPFKPVWYKIFTVCNTLRKTFVHRLHKHKKRGTSK